MQFIVSPSPVSDADITVPGDKSVSHRALMLGSIAEGTTRISGFLAGEDCLATLAAMRAMGVTIDQQGETEVVVHGVGLHGLTPPSGPLDLGNSGTGMRLMSGLLAGQAFDTELVGDESLTGRPMRRIITPLETMGAMIGSRDGMPPLRIAGGSSLSGIDYATPMASAQVKSAVLLAGLYAEGTTRVREPGITRDHTERMLRSMGVVVDSGDGVVTLTGRQVPSARDIDVPADLSSATFIMLAALLSPDADVVIRKVGLNPTRTGVLDIFLAMGADISIENRRDLAEEPVGDIRVRSSRLQGCEVDPSLVSLAIDEFPALFVAAGAAGGRTVFSGLEELRVKESDRIASMASGLAALGIDVTETPDGAIVQGGQFQPGAVDSFGDHRVAMSLAVAGSIASGSVQINDVEPVQTSFPGFAELLNSMGANIAQRSAVE
ncbi:MAG: 3-phosphoshikimate 1-carboxyvinyltransferase [Pseudomonadota bacterium]